MNIIEALRGRELSAKQIADMSDREILYQVVAWYLGDGSWADSFIDCQKQIAEARKQHKGEDFGKKLLGILPK